MVFTLRHRLHVPPYFSSSDLGDALPTVLSFTREKQEARAESFLNSILLSQSFVYSWSLFLSLTLYFLSSASSRFLSRINIPTTGLSTSTVYLLLAIRLGTSTHSRPPRGGIGRKAHLPRSFIPFPLRVNSRIRESDSTMATRYTCTVDRIETQRRNYAQKSHDFSWRFDFQMRKIELIWIRRRRIFTTSPLWYTKTQSVNVHFECKRFLRIAQEAVIDTIHENFEKLYFGRRNGGVTMLKRITVQIEI